MSHVDDGTLHAYLDGELSALEVTRVEAHVAECAPCRARLDEERDVIARASRILALAEPPERTAPPLHTLRYPRLGWRVRWPPLAWAATLVLALGIGWFVRGGLTGGGEAAPETAPLTGRTEPAPTDTQVAAQALAQREEPAPEPAASEAPPAGVPSVAEPRPDSLPVALGRATPDTTTQLALAETMQDSAARLVAEQAAESLYETRTGPAIVAVRGAQVVDTLELDQARPLVDGEVYAVSGLPIRSIMRGRLIGYAGIVVVEQPLDSSTVIRVETRRPQNVQLDAVVVGAAQADRARADTVAANFQLRGQARTPAAPAAPPPPALARRVAGLEIHIMGSVPADSLRKLLEKAAPIR